MKETIEELRKQVEEATRESVGAFIKGLPQLINQRLESSVAKVLGFSDTWGNTKDWDVDHCNGRTSVVSNYVSERARDIVHKVAESVITEKVIRNVMKECRDALLKDAKEQARREYKTLLYDKIHKLAEEKADEDAKKIFDEIDQISTDIELADPEAGKDPVGHAVMEDVIDDLGVKEEL